MPSQWLDAIERVFGIIVVVMLFLSCVFLVGVGIWGKYTRAPDGGASGWLGIFSYAALGCFMFYIMAKLR